MKEDGLSRCLLLLDESVFMRVFESVDKDMHDGMIEAGLFTVPWHELSDGRPIENADEQP